MNRLILLNTYLILLFFCLLALGSCRQSADSMSKGSLSPLQTAILTDTISRIASSYPGEIGVAVIIDNSDTIAVNDRSVYPMMSVFKMHQAIAICHIFDQTGRSLDSMISVRRDSLDHATWSPMLKEHSDPEFSVSVRELLRYALIQSDNNASNLMFRLLADVRTTDSLTATFIPRHSFQIAYTEENMSADHKKAYANYTSPSGAAMLINRLFTDSMAGLDNRDFIRQSLRECSTGRDRIVAPLIGKSGVSVAHKTGSGYSDNGILVAHNDVAYVTLPDGISYSLAVFIKDFEGNETEASEAIARISAVVYETLSRLP